MRTFRSFLFLFVSSLIWSASAVAQDYFVTYSHHMEEPGTLDVESQINVASPRAAHGFAADATELEYGVKAWWTSELYLDAQHTHHESSIFTGFRIENRFRPLMREHWINPVLYVEFADTSADKTMREVMGHDRISDFAERNDRAGKEREAELKLILSSDARGWNISENIIAEKKLNAPEPWEFGYAVGVMRPLALRASAKECSLCRENFSAGAEMYGGLGDRHSFGLRDTSHYLAPIVAWQLPNGPTLKVSPGFGLNENSAGFMLRAGVSYEINQIWSKLRRQK